MRLASATTTGLEAGISRNLRVSGHRISIANAATGRFRQLAVLTAASMIGSASQADAALSTGMKGHPTPMGVFSVIQKHKLHHSNIYSNAPMPFMQRITWSGVAMHAGVLPGYPASHGCIRMPMAFAMKMWNWTRMVARVIVTPGEMTPAAFSHPLLVTQKVSPVALEEPKVDAPLGVKGDKGADAGPAAKATSEAKLDLRSTVGRAETPLRAQTQTADATGADNSSTMSDASPAAAPTGDSKPST